MRATKLGDLEGRPELGAFVYHLKGILEASDRIQALIERLGAGFQDDEQVCEILAGLEVEVFHQLEYHAQQLRSPLDELVAARCPDDEEAERGEGL